jgi:hypothetical protein
MEVQSMSEFLQNNIRITPVVRLVTELEQINRHKLSDDTILECNELRCYYIKRQEHIISHLKQMLDLDKDTL